MHSSRNSKKRISNSDLGLVRWSAKSSNWGSSVASSPTTGAHCWLNWRHCTKWLSSKPSLRCFQGPKPVTHSELVIIYHRSRLVVAQTKIPKVKTLILITWRASLTNPTAFLKPCRKQMMVKIEVIKMRSRSRLRSNRILLWRTKRRRLKKNMTSNSKQNKNLQTLLTCQSSSRQ